MNIHNEQSDSQLVPGLLALVERYRVARAFDAAGIAQSKAERLNAYLAASRLKGCVVAVSGGIDSAVVLGLVSRAARLPGSPIEQVVAVLLPVHDRLATTGQAQATARGVEVCAAFDIDPVVLDLSASYERLGCAVDQALGVKGEGWARGQLVSYQRTPALYYLTSLLAQQGRPSVLVGTTNMDEGAYLGYFGKASDGMVDLQLISDLHKSEVRALAVALNVPASVLRVPPTGDMFDGRVDEEVFGAPYDFVELYLYALRNPAAFGQALREAGADARAQFELLAGRLERMHSYNRHKYLGKSPAVHLDVCDAHVPGGWDYFVWSPQP